MKITPGSHIPPTHQPQKVNESDDVKENKAQDHAANPTAAASHQQKILSWFSRVGISPSMSSPDPQREKQALARRKQILELQKASNLKAVLNIALNVSITESDSDNLDPDWFFAFSSLAEEIYSPAMQELWGKIFAVEISRPGSFSLRSLQLLKSLTHRDAKVFAKAVSIASRRNNDKVPRILVGFHRRKGLFSFLRRPVPEQVNLASVGLSYPDLLALQDMKLIYASEIESGEYTEGQQSSWRCGNENLQLESRTTGVALVYYKFTAVGSELYKLVSRHENQAYTKLLKSVLSEAFIIK
jgi:uncharacterized repeat protein (TIGR03899 family)